MLGPSYTGGVKSQGGNGGSVGAAIMGWAEYARGKAFSEFEAEAAEAAASCPLPRSSRRCAHCLNMSIQYPLKKSGVAVLGTVAHGCARWRQQRRRRAAKSSLTEAEKPTFKIVTRPHHHGWDHLSVNTILGGPWRCGCPGCPAAAASASCSFCQIRSATAMYACRLKASLKCVSKAPGNRKHIKIWGKASLPAPLGCLAGRRRAGCPCPTSPGWLC